VYLVLQSSKLAHAVVNLLLSIELGLKNILVNNGLSVPHTHKIEKIYNK